MSPTSYQTAPPRTCIIDQAIQINNNFSVGARAEVRNASVSPLEMECHSRGLWSCGFGVAHPSESFWCGLPNYIAKLASENYAPQRKMYTRVT